MISNAVWLSIFSII